MENLKEIETCIIRKKVSRIYKELDFLKLSLALSGLHYKSEQFARYEKAIESLIVKKSAYLAELRLRRAKDKILLADSLEIIKRQHDFMLTKILTDNQG